MFRSPRLLLFGGLIATLIALGLSRWMSADFDRPFEEDEWLTVSNYTWAETQPSGERNEFDKIGDYRSLPRPTMKQLAMGVYCAAGRWSEPNNHIFHSLLVNALQVAGRSERTVRLAALLGGLCFAGGVFWLCGPVLQWWSVAPLAFAVAWFWPYTIHFSQTARGYSWSLALPIFWLIAVHQSARRPRSLWLGVTCVSIAVLTFLNLVSLALDWLMPSYLAVLVSRPESDDPRPDPEEDREGWIARRERDRAAWRTNILAQILAIGGIGLTFLMAHLPAVFSSARQYGESFSSATDLFDLSASTIAFLFPGPGGKLLLVSGFIGVILMAYRKQCNSLSLLCFGVLIISMAHFAVTRRLPYARAAGYLILPAILGSAFLGETLLCLIPKGWIRAFACVILGLTIAAAGPGAGFTSSLIDYEDFLSRIGGVSPASGMWTVRIRSDSVDAASDLYRPSSWHSPVKLTPGHDAQVCFLVREGSNGDDGLSVFRRGAAEKWSPPTEPSVVVGPYKLTRVAGKTETIQGAGSDKALIFWYLEPEHLGLDGKSQIDLANDSGQRYLRQTIRHRVKMEVFGRLQALVFISTSADEYRECVRTVEEGIGRFGGSSVSLLFSE